MLQPPEAGRDTEGSFLAPLQGVWLCRYLDFGPVILVSNFWPPRLRDSSSIDLSYRVDGKSLEQPRGINTQCPPFPWSHQWAADPGSLVRVSHLRGPGFWKQPTCSSLVAFRGLWNMPWEKWGWSLFFAVMSLKDDVNHRLLMSFLSACGTSPRKRPNRAHHN